MYVLFHFPFLFLIRFTRVSQDVRRLVVVSVDCSRSEFISLESDIAEIMTLLF
jgi:hypothetical protein